MTWPSRTLSGPWSAPSALDSSHHTLTRCLEELIVARSSGLLMPFPGGAGDKAQASSEALRGPLHRLPEERQFIFPPATPAHQ